MWKPWPDPGSWPEHGVALRCSLGAWGGNFGDGKPSIHHSPWHDISHLDVFYRPIWISVYIYIYMYTYLGPCLVTLTVTTVHTRKKTEQKSSCSPQYDFHFPLLRLDEQSYSLQVGSTVGTFSCHVQKSLLSKFDIGISNGMPDASSLSAPCG